MKKTLLILTLILGLLFSFGCVKKVTPTGMKLVPEEGDTIAILKTNHGEIRMLLYTEKVPETAKNFVELSKEGKYNDTTFHRIIDNFMVQGGDFENRDGTGGHSYKGPDTYLMDETVEGLEHMYGAVSMAKSLPPHTAGSQFFVVQAKDGTGWLDGVHSVFGYVYEGMDNVESMADVETGAQDVPVEDVVLEEVIIEIY